MHDATRPAGSATVQLCKRLRANNLTVRLFVLKRGQRSLVYLGLHIHLTLRSSPLALMMHIVTMILLLRLADTNTKHHGRNIHRSVSDALARGQDFCCA